MKQISLYFTVLIVLAFNCFKKPLFNHSRIKAIHINYDMPLIGNNSNSKFTTQYDVFYYKDFIMYRNFYHFDSSVNSKIVLEEERPSYFIFHQDSLFGDLFYSNAIHSMPHGRIRVDSALREFSLLTNAYDSLRYLKPDSVFFDKQGNLIKAFNHSPDPDNPAPYTVYFYYSKMLVGIKETFSKEMDNEKNRKLFKIVTKSKEYYSKQYNVRLPVMELNLEMQKTDIKNKEEILGYFKKYESKGSK